MKLKAAALKGESDMFALCGTLHLGATRPGEAEWMAALNRLLIYGGELTINPNGRESMTVAFISTPDEVMARSEIRKPDEASTGEWELPL